MSDAFERPVSDAVDAPRPTAARGVVRKGNPWWTAARIGIAAGLLWYLTAYGGLDWLALGGMFRMWWWSVAAFGLIVASAVGTSWRFRLLLRPRGMDITLAASIRLTLIGQFFSTVLPGAGGGDLVRFYYGARGHEGRRAEIVTVMLFDRICGTASMVLWPLLAAPVFASMWFGNAVLTALLAGGAAVAVGLVAAFAVSWTPLAAGEGRLAGWLRGAPGGAAVWQAIETIASYRHHLGTVAAGIGVSLWIHAAQIGAALIVAYVIDPSGFAWAMTGLIPMGFMANVIPLTPGGLGVGEAAFDSLFALAGLDGGAEVILGWRLLVMLLGLGGLVAYLSSKRDFVRAASGKVQP